MESNEIDCHWDHGGIQMINMAIDNLGAQTTVFMRAQYVRSTDGFDAHFASIV